MSPRRLRGDTLPLKHLSFEGYSISVTFWSKLMVLDFWFICLDLESTVHEVCMYQTITMSPSFISWEALQLNVSFF